MKYTLWRLSNFSFTLKSHILRKDCICISAFRPASLLKSDSHLLKKMCVSGLIESPLIMMKNALYFILKSLFLLKIFKFLSRLFGHAGKTAWLERWGEHQNSWRRYLVCKQFQNTYFPISRKVNVTRQWNLVNY